MKWIIALVLILLLIGIFGYVNLMVSYKYEVDLTTTLYKVEGKEDLTEVNARAQEIESQKRNIGIVIGILIILLCYLIYKSSYNKNESIENKDKIIGK